jgi:hypothetical protein
MVKTTNTAKVAAGKKNKTTGPECVGGQARESGSARLLPEGSAVAEQKCPISSKKL